MEERTYSVMSLCQQVQAIYDYQGENNDELNIKKGDIITVTQTPEGGWFEGTLKGVTGWFPSNYVLPLDPSSSDVVTDGKENGFEVNGHASQHSHQSNREMRRQAIKQITESETGFIKELNAIQYHFLAPLAQHRGLPEHETQAILDAVSHVITTHSQFLSGLHFAIENKSSRSCRVGGVFMEFAGKMKQVHMHYCSLHPKFVSTVDKHKDIVADILKTSLKISPQASPVVQLNCSLSYPFRRLDKYPALLQELQRYTSESDPDRGDTQRAGFVFRELVSCCLDVRRRKEMELEVMLGNIENLPDNCPAIQSFGDIIRMGSIIVTQTPESGEVFLKDRYLVLFPSDLLVLSISREMTSFTFETRLALSDITLPRISNPEDPDKRSIDLLLTAGRKYSLLCPSPEDFNSWMSLMLEAKRSSSDSIYVRYSQLPLSTTGNNKDTSSVSRQSSSVSSGSSHNHHQTQVSTSPRPSPRPSLRSCRQTNGFWSDKSLLPHPVTTYADVVVNSKTPSGKLLSAKNRHQVKGKRPSSPADDMSIFQTIESYCTNTIAATGTAPRTPRKVPNAMHHHHHQQQHSSVLSGSSPSSSHQEDEPSLPQTVRLLVEEVQSLRKEMYNMRRDMEVIADTLRREQEARMKLERNLAAYK